MDPILSQYCPYSVHASGRPGIPKAPPRPAAVEKERSMTELVLAVAIFFASHTIPAYRPLRNA